MLPSNRSWPMGLLISVNGAPELYQYTPRSDFCIVMKDLPVLLLEVTSDKDHVDEHCMILQASCVVHLGNVLLKDKSPKFVLKAIYVDEGYNAIEHTFYQREVGLHSPGKTVNFLAYCWMTRS